MFLLVSQLTNTKMPVTQKLVKYIALFFCRIMESITRQTYHETFQLFQDIACYKAVLNGR